MKLILMVVTLCHVGAEPKLCMDVPFVQDVATEALCEAGAKAVMPAVVRASEQTPWHITRYACAEILLGAPV